MSTRGEADGAGIHEAAPIVYVVDDDPDVCNLLKKLIQSVGLTVETHTDAREFLEHLRPVGPSCLVLDMRMPGLGGLDLQRRLTEAGIDIPIIFLTGFASVPLSVQAMKGGAVDFLEKPFENQALIDAVQRAVEASRRLWRERAEREKLRKRVASLSPREKQVFLLVISGMPNKQIAAELGTSEKTIKIHRARVMQKMMADSLAALVHMADRLEIKPPAAHHAPR
jgi:RNA polymerase sigma factor (sigma-70 family)